MRSGVPTYLQLVQQVEHALRLGYLGQGDRLPTVKEVVSSLAINPNTVLKAYRELEHRGLAAGRPGQGTFVRGTPGTVGLPELTALRKTLLVWLRSADSAGLDEAGMVALFTSALRDFNAMTVAARPRCLATVTAAAARQVPRREWHERHRDLRARQALRADLGAEGRRARRSRPATSWRWSARTARARPRCCTCRSA